MGRIEEEREGKGSGGKGEGEARRDNDNNKTHKNTFDHLLIYIQQIIQSGISCKMSTFIYLLITLC
jgi:hypothetical protein